MRQRPRNTDRDWSSNPWISRQTTQHWLYAWHTIADSEPPRKTADIMKTTTEQCLNKMSNISHQDYYRCRFSVDITGPPTTDIWQRVFFSRCRTLRCVAVDVPPTKGTQDGHVIRDVCIMVECGWCSDGGVCAICSHQRNYTKGRYDSTRKFGIDTIRRRDLEIAFVSCRSEVMWSCPLTIIFINWAKLERSLCTVLKCARNPETNRLGCIGAESQFKVNKLKENT